MKAMNRYKTTSRVLLLAILLFTLFSNRSGLASICQSNARVTVNASVDTESEYSSGSLELTHAMNIWYTWINTSSTQVAFFTYYSEVYNSPIVTFLGQHYTANQTEVFVGNTLLLMEAYSDADGDQIPDADYEGATGEIVYFFLVNSSQVFIPTPVQKAIVDGVPHYTWGIEYGGVDGFLLYPEDKTVNGVTTNLAAKVNVLNLAFHYDYYIEGSVSYLKTSYEVGQLSEVDPYTPAASLDGLGLSLLYGTTMVTPKPYTVLVNGNPYSSREAEAQTTSTTRAEIIVEEAKLYEFVFEKYYARYRESHTETYVAQYSASPLDSIPPNAAMYLSPNWLVGWLLRFLSEDTFPTMSARLSTIDLEYNNSSFVYRFCYPTWEGDRLTHDPTYIAYLAPNGSVSPPPERPPFESLVATVITIAGLLVLSLALVELRKTRRIIKPNLFTSPPNLGDHQL